MNLFEREGAFALFDESVADALSGRGRVVLVSGATATGKSVLLYALAERGRAIGVLPVPGTASRVERDLPMGLATQLIRCAPLAAKERTRILDLLAGATRSAEEPGGATEDIDVQLVHTVGTMLLELAERRPLVITVDDVQFADRASLLCLAYLARRAQSAPLVLVASQSYPDLHVESFAGAELLHQPHCRTVELAPLSRAGVRSLAGDLVGEEDGARLSTRWYALSGGNPLLVRALADDYRNVERTDGCATAEPVVGDRYGRGVLACLGRAEPTTLQVARGLAVLGGVEALDRLSGLSSDDVTRALRWLASTGLTTANAFRHEAARAAVLADMDAGARAELHRAAAEASYRGGAPATLVAEHLRQADQVPAPWAVFVLDEAARRALHDGRIESAIGYLRLAQGACTDGPQRTAITMTLIRAEARTDPTAHAGHLAYLALAIRRGWLRGPDVAVVVRGLLWHGQEDRAREVLDHLVEPDDTADPETACELVTLRHWLRCTYPSLHTDSRLWRLTCRQDRAMSVPVPVTRRLASARLLSQVLSRGPSEDIVGTAERILRRCRVDDASLDAIEWSLLALAYGDQPERAAAWYDRFSLDGSLRQAPTWRARLLAVRAEIAIRQGDMPGGEHHARSALDLVPVGCWRLALGDPLGSLIVAATAMGRYEAAAGHLDVPVPPGMFQTRYGLQYLRARGRFNLAIDEPTLALRDFQRCGQLMAGWGLDAPGFLPWRVDAAEAYLHMGRIDEARALAEIHVSRCGPEVPRAHGIGLRVLAATSDPQHRPTLLRGATDLLQAAGDRYEMARGLFDLAEAHRVLGEYRRAAPIAHRAEVIAQAIRTDPLIDASRGDRNGRNASWSSESDASAVLSDAEQRVAALAAAGYSNREIANKLWITVSTVEQHLTRTYRKLEVTRRADLPATLRPVS